MALPEGGPAPTEHSRAEFKEPLAAPASPQRPQAPPWTTQQGRLRHWSPTATQGPL